MILLIIQASVDPPEDESSDESENRWSAEIPGDIRILDQAGKGKTERVCECGREEVERGHETTHVLGRHGVSDSVGRDIDEEFGYTTDSEGNGCPPDGDVRDERNAVGVNARCRGTIMSTWAKLVGVVVEDGVSYTTGGGEAQTEGDTGDGTEPDVPVAEERVKAVVKNGCCDDN